jgi:hypothetical protein
MCFPPAGFQHEHRREYMMMGVLKTAALEYTARAP